MVGGSIGGSTFAIRRESQTPFAPGRMKMPNASPQATFWANLIQDVLGKSIIRDLELALEK